MQRLIALLIMVIPGVLAAYGIKLMRDMLFNIQHPLIPSLFVQFIVGLLLFVLGLGFIAGFIFHRDKKRNKLQPKLRKRP